MSSVSVRVQGPGSHCLRLREISAEGTWIGGAVEVPEIGGRPAMSFSPSGDSLALCAHSGVEVQCRRLDPTTYASLTGTFLLTSGLASLDQTGLTGLRLLDDSRLVASWDSHSTDHPGYAVVVGQFSLSGARLRPRLTANIAWEGDQLYSTLLTPTATTSLVVYVSEELDGDGEGVAVRLLPTY